MSLKYSDFGPVVEKYKWMLMMSVNLTVLNNFFFIIIII